MALLLAAVCAGAQAPSRRWTTVERLSDERLAAAHADVERLRAAVARPAGSPGLNDYRAVFHAHAGDSAHTGGTPEELLRDARRIGVDIVFLSDHFRPPRDFMNGWRGVREGVLFVPGSEAAGYLLHPERSVFALMQGEAAPLLEAVEAGGGMAFLSHIEDHDNPSTAGVTGMEIYNRHADAKDDGESLRTLAAWMTDPDEAARLGEAIRRFPEEVFAAQLDYPADYLAVWDREGSRRRVVGVAAADCHHNQVFLVKKLDERSARLGTVVDEDEQMTVLTADQRPRLPELLAGHMNGDEVARFDIDPYWVSMGSNSTHVLAAELNEPAVRAAVAAGRVYVSHDWMADPTGFSFVLTGGDGDQIATMGDELSVSGGEGHELVARFSLPARIRLLRNGEEVTTAHGSELAHELELPGVYRVEGWLEVDGEWRPWIYSNPIYARLGVTKHLGRSKP
jgi:hypothetical protein